MKRPAPRIVATLAIALLLALGATAAEALSVLLQKAIYAEETEGNLDSAIKLYEQIAAEMSANRPIAAQAQYRLAVCYQKQGKKPQAVSTLNALLKQFPSESSLSEKIHDRLAELGQTAVDEVIIRKVPLSTSWTPAISLEGRYVLYQGPRLDMWVGDLSDGKSWLSIKSDGDKYPWSAAFSPDSRHIAYEFSGGVYVIGNEPDAKARQILPGNGKPGAVTILGWSSTGAQIITRSFGDKKMTPVVWILNSVDTVTGEQRELLRYDHIGKKVADARLSLSGRYIAFRSTADGSNRDEIRLVDLLSGADRILVDREVDEVLGWIEGDSKLVFSSDRTGSMSLWAVAVKDGNAAGQPELIRSDIGDVNKLAITRNGKFFFARANSTDTIHVAAVDFDTGEITRPPRPASQRFPGVQTCPLWSADGQKLMIAIQRGQKRFVSISPASGDEADFPVSAAFTELPIQKTAWSDSGNFVLVQARRVSDSHGIHRYDLGLGKAETLVRQRDTDGYDWNGHPRIAPDGKSFYYNRRKFTGRREEGNSDWNDRIVRRDLQSGEEQVVYEPAAKLQVWWPFEVSPDGRRLAVVESDQFAKADFVAAISIIESATKERKEVVRFAPRENVTSIGWLPDGLRLVYSKQPLNRDGEPHGEAEVGTVTIDSGRIVRLNLSLPQMRDVTVNPDGKQIAFRTGGSEGRELWLMEGLWPKLASRRVATAKY